MNKTIVTSFFVLQFLFIMMCVMPFQSCHSPQEPIVQSRVHFVDSLCDSVACVDTLLQWEQYFYQHHDYEGAQLIESRIGDLYSTRSNFSQALVMYTRSLALSRKLHDTLMIISNMNAMGNSYRYLGMMTESADLHFRSLIFSEQWSDQSSPQALRMKASSYKGIGQAQMALHNYKRAESAFRKALEKEQELDNYEEQAVSYANLGEIKKIYGEPDSAFWYYERSLEFNRMAESKIGISKCYIHFGSLAEKNEDWDAALRYYYRAYELLKRYEDPWHTTEACLCVARVYIQRGDMLNAKHYIDESWNTAKQIRSWELMSKAAILQADYEERHQRYSSALSWHKMGDAYADSMVNEAGDFHVSHLIDQFISERTFKEMELVRQHYMDDRSTQMQIIWWGVLFFVVVSLVIVFLYGLFRLRLMSRTQKQRIEKIRTDFFTNVSHEIRTPLTVIMGLARQLAEGQNITSEKDCRNLGQTLVKQGDVLLNLVSEFLDFAKARTNRGNSEWRTGNIVPFVTMITENSRAYALQKQVYLAYVCNEREIKMDFIPEYIRKMLQNLLINAVNYSGVSGKVSVQMNSDKKKLYINLKDTGRGMAEKDLPHIFDPFYTASNTTIEMSTGVGLATVRAMVLAMGGTISVNSTLGVGTEFFIEFPLRHGDGKWPTVDQADVETAKKYKYPEILPSGQPENNQKHTMNPCILVIEDNRDVATYIGTQLAQYYRVIYAADGVEGLKKAQEVMPDLIVSDLMMPGLDGNEVCGAIRNSEVLNHIPVIIISAKSSEEDRLKGLEMGADAYLCKPFNAHELLVIISNLLGQRESMRQKYSVHSNNEQYSVSGLKAREREFLTRLVDVVYHEMAHGNLDSESLASAMCMSSSQLRRKVFALSGEKLNTFVLQIRLKRASNLLVNQPDLPIGEVASRCGFEDAAYFSRIFKNAYQVTPSLYRRQVALKERLS